MTTPLEQIKERLEQMKKEQVAEINLHTVKGAFDSLAYNQAISDVQAILPSIIQEVVDSVINDVKENQLGTFTDDAGNACWYLDTLVERLESLKEESK